MRTLEEIDQEIKTLRDAHEAMSREKAAKLQAAKDAVLAEYRAAEAEALSNFTRLDAERDQVLAATVTHPLEGRLLTHTEIRRDRSYSMRSKDRNVTRRARIVVIRSYADMPPRNQNNRSRRWPEIGDVIAQYVNAKGEKIGEWEDLRKTDAGEWPELRHWNLAEENA